MPVPGELAQPWLTAAGVMQPPLHDCALVVLMQVFEYLSTDMKKWMDRNGRGAAHPLPKPQIKVGGKASMLEKDRCGKAFRLKRRRGQGS
jgi:hypothetical protein